METKHDRKSISPFWIALVANVIWATSFLSSKYTLMTWGPVTASYLRFILAATFLLGFAFVAKKSIKIPGRNQWVGIFVVGATAFGFLYPLQLSGLKFITTALSAVVMLFAPLFVIVFGHLILKEKFEFKKLIAVVLGIVGGYLLLQDKIVFSSNLGWGLFLTALAAVSLAGSVVATRQLAVGMDTLSLTFWSMITGLIVMTPFLCWEIVEARAVVGLENIFNSAAALLYLSLICSTVAFFLWNFAISKAPAKTLATTMHIKTPVAILIGVLLLRESFTIVDCVGTLIVVSAVWLSQTERKFVFNATKVPEPQSVKVVTNA